MLAGVGPQGDRSGGGKDRKEGGTPDGDPAVVRAPIAR
jgi:hypothetical protein